MTGKTRGGEQDVHGSDIGLISHAQVMYRHSFTISRKSVGVEEFQKRSRPKLMREVCHRRQFRSIAGSDAMICRQ